MSVRRFLPRYSVLPAAVLVLITCATVRDRINDLDLWWHLKGGELIATTHALPKTDPFSYSAPNAQWVTQEWLSEVTIYQAYSALGDAGLALWLFAFSTAIVGAGYGLCLFCSRDTRVAFLGGLLIWLFSTIGMAVRPHMVGYLLLTAELFILNLALRRRTRWLYALPLLFLIWVNAHGSFSLGMAVLGAFCVCSFVRGEFGAIRFLPWRQKDRRRLSIAAGLSVAALFANPVGLTLLRYPVDVLFSQPLSASYVMEWRAPDLTSPRGVALLIVSLAVVSLPFISRRMIYAHELILFLAGFWLAMRHQRMLFVFGIFAAPVLCRLLQQARRPRANRPQEQPVLNAVLLAALCVFIVRCFPPADEIQKQFRRDNPVEALAFIRQAKLSGPMMNDYDFGGYLIWAAPERKVFIDGRSDMYEPAGVMADYADWIDLRDTRRVLDKYGIRYCLLAPKSRIAKAMLKAPLWKRVYADSKAVVLVRKD